MACGSRNEAVGSIALDRFSAEIVRGDEPLERPFRLEQYYHNRGVPYRPLL
jgi:hypothetical protein